VGEGVADLAHDDHRLALQIAASQFRSQVDEFVGAEKDLIGFLAFRFEEFGHRQAEPAQDAAQGRDRGLIRLDSICEIWAWEHRRAPPARVAKDRAAPQFQKALADVENVPGCIGHACLLPCRGSPSMLSPERI
jgi:hypothetical protein